MVVNLLVFFLTESLQLRGCLKNREVYWLWFPRTRVMCQWAQLQRDQIDELYHETMEKRDDEKWAAVWFHTEKEHYRCDVYFESVDGKVYTRRSIEKVRRSYMMYGLETAGRTEDRWQRWRCSDFHWEWTERTGMSQSEGQYRLSSLEANLKM